MEERIKITDDSQNANEFFMQNMSRGGQVAAGPIQYQKRHLYQRVQ